DQAMYNNLDPSEPGLYTSTGNTLATANAFTAFLPPWFGRIRATVSFTCTAGSMGASNVVTVMKQLGPTADIAISRAVPVAIIPNTWQVITEFDPAGRQAGIVVNNVSGANFTNLNIIAVPFG